MPAESNQSETAISEYRDLYLVAVSDFSGQKRFEKLELKKLKYAQVSFFIGNEIETRKFRTYFLLCVGVPIILPLLFRTWQVISLLYSHSHNNTYTRLS